MPDPRADSTDQFLFTQEQLVLLFGSLKPVFLSGQYASLGRQMQQLGETLSEGQLRKMRIRYFKLHILLMDGQALDAVVSSLQQLLDT
jgi:hypothetical protein